MLNRSNFKASLLLVGLATLAACSSESSDEESTNLPATQTEAGSDLVEMENADLDVEETDVDTIVSGNPDLSNPIPLIATTMCDESLISTTAFSNSESNPALFSANEIVRGRIDPESAGNTEHYWNIDLQPGFYHLVLDDRRVDDEDSNLGLELIDLKGAGDEDDFVLLDETEIFDFRLRQSMFFEVEAAETLRLKVLPLRGAEDYTIGIFENGSAVPSPVTEDCYPIQTLSLDTPQSVVLESNDTDFDDLYFQIELPLGDYTLTSTASRVDGEDRNIIYEFTAASQFGESDRYEEVLDVREGDNAMRTDSDTLSVSQDGVVFLRLESRIVPLNIEFTLTAN